MLFLKEDFHVIQDGFGTQYVAKANLELMILLSLPPKC